MRHAELRQRLAACAHRLPIGLAAHDDADERRLVSPVEAYSPWASETLLPVEGVEVFDLDEVEIRLVDAIAAAPRSAACVNRVPLPHEAAAPSDRCRTSRRSRRDKPSCRDCSIDYELQPVAVELLELLAEFLRIALVSSRKKTSTPTRCFLWRAPDSQTCPAFCFGAFE